MRYSVVFDEVIDAWALVDSEAAGMTISFHPTEEAAAQAAAAENGFTTNQLAAE